MKGLNLWSLIHLRGAVLRTSSPQALTWLLSDVATLQRANARVGQTHIGKALYSQINPTFTSIMRMEVNVNGKFFARVMLWQMVLVELRSGVEYVMHIGHVCKIIKEKMNSVWKKDVSVSHCCTFCPFFSCNFAFRRMLFTSCTHIIQLNLETKVRQMFINLMCFYFEFLFSVISWCKISSLENAWSPWYWLLNSHYSWSRGRQVCQSILIGTTSPTTSMNRKLTNAHSHYKTLCACDFSLKFPQQKQWLSPSLCFINFWPHHSVDDYCA